MRCPVGGDIIARPSVGFGGVTYPGTAVRAGKEDTAGVGIGFGVDFVKLGRRGETARGAVKPLSRLCIRGGMYWVRREKTNDQQTSYSVDTKGGIAFFCLTLRYGSLDSLSGTVYVMTRYQNSALSVEHSAFSRRSQRTGLPVLICPHVLHAQYRFRIPADKLTLYTSWSSSLLSLALLLF
jgi:hypothetical protein